MSELTYYDLKSTVAIAPSMSVQVARELGRRVVAGIYPPESLLDEETTLAKRYQVSRAVIRDAVKLLVSKGLLDVRRGIGTKVRPRTHWNLLDDDVLAWHLSSTPPPEFLEQLMEIRLAFEPKAARWAAERGGAEDIAAIAKACEDMCASEYTTENEDSVKKFIKADALFHRAVLKAARNEFLQAVEGVIYSALLISIHVTNKDPLANGTSITLHQQVYEAIAARDPMQAEQLTAELLRDASKRLRESAR